MRNFKLLLISGRAEVELLAAKDGRSALELAQARSPDLILLDLQLSDMNGLELIDQLKTGSETPQQVLVRPTLRLRGTTAEVRVMAGASGMERRL